MPSLNCFVHKASCMSCHSLAVRRRGCCAVLFLEPPRVPPRRPLFTRVILAARLDKFRAFGAGPPVAPSSSSYRTSHHEFSDLLSFDRNLDIATIARVMKSIPSNANAKANAISTPQAIKRLLSAPISSAIFAHAAPSRSEDASDVNPGGMPSTAIAT